MEWSDWLIAVVPIFSFGLIPVVGTLIGGKPTEQSMGIALGGFVFSLAVFLFRRPELSMPVFLIGFLSGVFWSVGSIGQFVGINYLGVARATPMLNGGYFPAGGGVGRLGFRRCQDLRFSGTGFDYYRNIFHFL